VIFSSDNGGPLGFAATNGPLRAGKGTVYEGGVRVAAWAAWPGKIAPGTKVTETLQMVDWYPTLLKLAGAPARQALPVDGRDVWAAVAEGKPTPRDEWLLNVEPREGAVRKGPWKLVATNTPLGDESSAPAPGSLELFNLQQDPYEKTNLAEQDPQRTADLLKRLHAYARQAIAPKASPAAPGFKAPAVWGEND
jgi:arylsulfatase I/J